MKCVLVIFVLAGLTLAECIDDVNWSTIKYRRTHLKVPFDPVVVFDNRVAGGEVTEPNSIPYQAALIITSSTGSYLCGGVLVTKRHILTSAGCLDGASAVEVRLGAHFWNQLEDTQQRFTTTEFKIHNEWDDEFIINDIGVVTLPVEAILTEYVQLATLPSRSEIDNTFYGAEAVLSGWGLVSENDWTPSDVLRILTTWVIENQICDVTYLGNIFEKQICTSGYHDVGACPGDGGGPLVVDNTLVGIVSYTISLGCQQGWPTVHTRITAYLDWIEANTDAIIG